MIRRGRVLLDDIVYRSLSGSGLQSNLIFQIPYSIGTDLLLLTVVATKEHLQNRIPIHAFLT
jgi:hypothetical protein